MSSQKSVALKLPVSKVVLDASALLALMNAEPGADRVIHALLESECVLLSVNLTEVLTRLIDRGASAQEAADRIQTTGLTIVAFDQTLAVAAAKLRTATRPQGLSLGDRACLALAQQLGTPALTADRAWRGLDLGIEIEMIRA